MSLIILGGDPGVSGAVAGIDAATYELVFVIDAPVVDKSISPHALHAALTEHLAGHTVWLSMIERVGTRPNEARNSAFNFGRSTGRLEGVLGCHGRCEWVTPAVWKKHYGLKGSDAAAKAASRYKAMNIWPSEARRFGRVKDDGRAEAALIARYAAELFPPPPSQTQQLSLLTTC